MNQVIELDKKRFKMLCAKVNLKLGEVILKSEIPKSTWNYKLDKCNASILEHQILADVLGCRFYFAFINKKDGSEFTGETFRDVLWRAARYSGVSFGEMEKQMGISRQAFSEKITKGKLTANNRNDIAQMTNCDYINYFIFDDGTKL